MSSRKSKKEQKSKQMDDSPKSFNIKDLPNINYSELYNKAKLYSPISKVEEKWELVQLFFKFVV